MMENVKIYDRNFSRWKSNQNYWDPVQKASFFLLVSSGKCFAFFFFSFALPSVCVCGGAIRKDEKFPGSNWSFHFAKDEGDVEEATESSDTDCLHGMIYLKNWKWGKNRWWCWCSCYKARVKSIFLSCAVVIHATIFPTIVREISSLQ